MNSFSFLAKLVVVEDDKKVNLLLDKAPKQLKKIVVSN